MAWRFEPGEALHDAFSRTAMQAVERARADLTSTELTRDQAIHRVRRRFKKLRALIRLARPSLGASYESQNRRWRDAGRLLAASRDATVLLGSFDKIAEGCAGVASARAIAGLRLALVRSQPAEGEGGRAKSIAGALRLLDSGGEELADLRWPATAGKLARGLEDSLALLRRSWKTARRETSSETLHDWRKRVKDLSTQLALFRAVLPPELKHRRTEANALAAALGEEHDLWLLGEALAPLKPSAAASKARPLIMDAIERRREALRLTAFRMGGPLSDSPKAFARQIVARWEEAGESATAVQSDTLSHA